MRFRLFTEQDLTACAALVHPGFAPSTVAREDLPAIWRRLLHAEQLVGGIIVDGSGDDHAIVAIGPAVFVDDAFVDAALRAPRPYLSAHVYEAMREGRSPVLDIEQVRHANATSGLNLLILHYGQVPWDLADERSVAILTAANACFRLAYDGYRLRRVLEEVSAHHLSAKLAAGFSVKSTYGRDSRLDGDDPVLVGLFADDPASRLPGSTAASIFQHRAPRFFFSIAEQRVLSRATLEEAEDQVIAGRLGISTDAIRQTWRRIYQRVADVDPAVLGVEAGAPERTGTRGPEKRRHLIEYLRFHLEELRPYRSMR